VSHRVVSRTRGRVTGAVPFSAVDGTGNRYVIFLQGCGFDCLTCHNPATIPLQPRWMEQVTAAETIAPVVESARFLTGVTIGGGEPTVQSEFVEALLAGLAEQPATAHLTRFLDSNGDAPREVWRRLTPLLHGVMLDLKALDDERHLVLTGQSNRRVLEALDTLAAAERLEEVRLLLVPGLNDDDAQLTRTARYLTEHAPGVRIRVNAYRRHGTRACARFLLEVKDADRERYRAVLGDTGLTNLVVA